MLNALGQINLQYNTMISYPIPKKKKSSRAYVLKYLINLTQRFSTFFITRNPCDKQKCPRKKFAEPLLLRKGYDTLGS
jgi:hypothetical protein